LGQGSSRPISDSCRWSQTRQMAKGGRAGDEPRSASKVNSRRPVLCIRRRRTDPLLARCLVRRRGKVVRASTGGQMAMTQTLDTLLAEPSRSTRRRPDPPRPPSPPQGTRRRGSRLLGEADEAAHQWRQRCRARPERPRPQPGPSASPSQRRFASSMAPSTASSPTSAARAFARARERSTRCRTGRVWTRAARLSCSCRSGGRAHPGARAGKAVRPGGPYGNPLGCRPEVLQRSWPLTEAASSLAAAGGAARRPLRGASLSRPRFARVPRRPCRRPSARRLPPTSPGG
jgi:hypothetical protein